MPTPPNEDLSASAEARALRAMIRDHGVGLIEYAPDRLKAFEVLAARAADFDALLGGGR